MSENEALARNGNLQRHWAVPMAVHHFSHSAEVNPVLVAAFHAIRAADQRTFPGGLYASADDLLRKIDLPEFSGLIKFVVASLNATAQDANANAWPAGRHGLELELMGVWFQGSFHDVHTHGNCSWSGVYYVQIDTPDKQRTHPEFGALNGATRFYSPLFMHLGGAYVDRGNAWMRSPPWTSCRKRASWCCFPRPCRTRPCLRAAIATASSFRSTRKSGHPAATICCGVRLASRACRWDVRRVAGAGTPRGHRTA